MSSASDRSALPPPSLSPPLEVKPLPSELWPSIDHIVTEDGAPVDNVFSEKQMRLLTESLYASWQTAAPFVAFANVGLFYDVAFPPIVPDVLLSVGVRLPENLFPKINRSYFVWAYGKSPEVAIEIVSNRQGKEDTDKLALYAKARVPNYYVFDPEHHLSDEILRGFKLGGGHYTPMSNPTSMIEQVQLRLTLWNGRYEDTDGLWLRWVDSNGELLATGFEFAQQQKRLAAEESRRAAEESRRAAEESQRAAEESRRAEEAELEKKRLIELLKQHGIDPHGQG
ncbi:Uma2 family endonuclease [Neorhodopirellula pilleata]|uniref:Putative restriction endonuclease domain-containing protein n=1 Tax=Neorhodopirellula pilleata TaxID=2714738 RepID=A0A5C5ZQI4_9BACT|nr:Uma2 family endonuclease [Neorhodopirellula pilleata]TWT89520.1 hypothetical protein Pla100_54490 [Neorhodopirellula pilleata]